MKINFKEISCKLIDGSNKKFDLSELIGNLMYFNVADINKLDIAKDIYNGKEVELKEDDVNLIVSLTENNPNLPAFAKMGLLNVLNNIK